MAINLPRIVEDQILLALGPNNPEPSIVHIHSLRSDHSGRDHWSALPHISQRTVELEPPTEPTKTGRADHCFSFGSGKNIPGQRAGEGKPGYEAEKEGYNPNIAFRLPILLVPLMPEQGQGEDGDVQQKQYQKNDDGEFHFKDCIPCLGGGSSGFVPDELNVLYFPCEPLP